ncbi:aspartate--tRNA(Asn) ligase [Candidatus Dojkabacteria bacterium]|uniref:Aspartate--tRNA ligase n=1 Tax=Candidatus Dojkabacteria bacterium TaxID=2099670 RepID=A0A847D1I5_9BACT|nr:aspartate--tRNA(Asn) ligase [Candidatus Dojkabacteria bacterium]
MKRTLLIELKNKIGDEVRIRGIVETIRDQGKIIFFIIKDRSASVQAVCWIGNGEELFNTAKKVTTESIVDVTGIVKEAKQVSAGYELEIKNLVVDSLAQTPLPIVIEEEHSDNLTALNKRLDYRWIDLRSKKNHLMFEVATTMTKALRDYCLENEFTEIQAPRIISAASEGGANVFEVKYFDRKAYLAQSPQFHKQMAMAAGFERVFNVGPVFRAEKSFTTRHLTEYTSFDVEMSYIDSFKDVCEFEESMIKHMLKEVKEKYGETIKDVFGVDVVVPEGKFPFLTVEEAKKKLKDAGIPSKDDGDFSPEEERAIGEIMQKETGSEFVFMIDYPHRQRAFYHMKNSEHPTLALGYDLFWKGVEITTGAQREHRYEELKKNAIERNISEDSLEDYFDYFKYGCPPHGGFAIGTERLLMKLLEVDSVLEATYLPNTPNRLGKLLGS